MTKSFNKFKKLCFQSIFPNFGAKNLFPENPTLSSTTSYGFLAPCQNSEKTNDTITRKSPNRKKLERWMKERMEEQTLFYRTLLATAGGPILD